MKIQVIIPHVNIPYASDIYSSPRNKTVGRLTAISLKECDQGVRLKENQDYNADICNSGNNTHKV